jgi:hypothetical protein
VKDLLRRNAEQVDVKNNRGTGPEEGTWASTVHGTGSTPAVPSMHQIFILYSLFSILYSLN